MFCPRAETTKRSSEKSRQVFMPLFICANCRRSSKFHEQGIKTGAESFQIMTQYIIKLLISAAIIVAVSEVSKRSSLIGGLLASLPLTSFLAMLWLYKDTKDTAKVAALSMSIFWLVLPSLV